MQARFEGVKEQLAVDDSVFVFQEFLFQRVFIHFVDWLVFRGSAGLALQFAEQMFQCVVQLGSAALSIACSRVSALWRIPTVVDGLLAALPGGNLNRGDRACRRSRPAGRPPLGSGPLHNVRACSQW